MVTGKHGHPVANSDGLAYEHRVVLFDAIGAGEHACMWCSKPLRWEVRKGPNKLIVDHIDGKKQHNDRVNLAPACHPCNYRRGMFLAWVLEHAGDPVLHQLYESARAQRRVA